MLVGVVVGSKQCQQTEYLISHVYLCYHSVSIGKGISVKKCSFDPTGSVVAVACEDCTIKLFDTSDLEKGALCELQAHNDAVEDILFSAQKGQLVSGSSDGTVRTWAL